MQFLSSESESSTAVLLVVVGAVVVIVAMFMFGGGPKKALDGSSSTQLKFPLIEKEVLSHDTRRFRFALPSPDHILGLPVGQHINLSYKDGKTISRAYTPVTSDNVKGYMDLIIKVYFKNVHPKFPAGGKMGQYLNDMKIGDTINVRGPSGKINYSAPRTFTVQKGVFAGDYKRVSVEKITTKHVGMIAGGSGITPMLQVLTQILSDPKDDTEVHLLYANQSEKDILCRDQLEKLNEAHDNLKIWFTIDKAEDDTWTYDTGFITKTMIENHLPVAQDDCVVLICGPPPMIKFACLPALTELNVPKSRILTF